MNIEKFNPKKNPKYIGYIFRFLKKKSKLRKDLGAYPRIVKFKEGFESDIGWFIVDAFVAGFVTAPKKLRHFVLLEPLKRRLSLKSNGMNTNVSECVH